MAWHQSFISALQAPSITPIYTLEIIRSNYGVGAPIEIFSNRIGNGLQITRARVQGTQVIPHRWSVSFGGFEVDLVGDITQYSSNLMRGCIAILYVQLVGLSGKERIGIGQLDRINGQRGVYRAVFKDILSAFQSRIDTRVSGTKQLSKFFYNSVNKSRVQTVWNPSDTSLVVSNSSLFSKSSAHRGLLYCVPISGSDPFYLGWSSKNDGTNTFTLSSGSAVHPSSASASQLGLNSDIYNAVRINAGPYAFFAQIVTSTGNGTNGPNDVLPVSYGTGSPLPHSFVDYSDAFATSTYIKGATGATMSWDYTAIAPIDGGLRTLMDTASIVGQWPVMRQNAFSWRGCFDPTGQYGLQPATAAKITDADIISVENVDFFDPNLKAPYMQSAMIYNISGTSVVRSNSFTKALPTDGRITRDFGFYYDPNFNESLMAQGDRDRMVIWDFYHWARVSMRVSLKYAALCAGDKVEVSSRFIVDPYTQAGRTYINRPAMVLEIGYNIDERTCDIVIGVPPLF